MCLAVHLFQFRQYLGLHHHPRVLPKPGTPGVAVSRPISRLIASLIAVFDSLVYL